MKKLLYITLFTMSFVGGLCASDEMPKYWKCPNKKTRYGTLEEAKKNCDEPVEHKKVVVEAPTVIETDRGGLFGQGGFLGTGLGRRPARVIKPVVVKEEVKVIEDTE